jgi:hypothetical protein
VRGQGASAEEEGEDAQGGEAANRGGGEGAVPMLFFSSRATGPSAALELHDCMRTRRSGS